MVPTFTCGFERSNFSLAISVDLRGDEGDEQRDGSAERLGASGTDGDWW
jgi:hypothetical protein